MKHVGFFVCVCLLVILQVLDMIFNNQSNVTPIQCTIVVLLVFIVSILYDISDNIAKLIIKKNLQEFEDRMVELTRSEGLNKIMSIDKMTGKDDEVER